MEGLSTCFFWSIISFLVVVDSAAVDTVTVDQVIRDGDTLVSAGAMFELGFFTPGNSKNRYLGIWYNKISPQTVVWVANRETPITDRLGMFKVSHEGTLLVLSGDDTVVWSSESSVSVRNINPVTQLLDSGNLVVRNESSMDQAMLVWQSFDYPGDTHLPGMKLGKDLVTGIERRLTSWKSPDDPSPGEYVNYVDTNGFPQITQRRGSVITFRIGPWNGLRFNGFPSENQNPIFTFEFVFNREDIYYKFDLINSSHLSRVYLNPEGSIFRLSWLNHTQGWFLYLLATVDTCSRYGFCGPYGFCDDKNSPLCSCSHYGLCGPYGSCDINSFPTCSCMEGFEPRHPEEWNAANWSSGCQRKTPLNCGNEDGFRKISGVKFPDTQHSWYNLSMTLGECELACKSNCSCTAYSNVDIRSGGSGCLLWFDELIDVKVYNETQDLYIKMAASELTGLTVSQYGFNQKIHVLTVALPISSVGLVLLGLSVAAVYACRQKKKRLRRKGQGLRVHARSKRHTNVQNEDIELPFFSLSEIAKATNNFSIDNKLGEGGFGPVYKGVFEEGQKVAVKRLSRTSQQGIDEFKNEVTCIAKLQHRNLVKLLGYCIHRDELILIYEYMANKSLDSFLFDETRSLSLDWPRRFYIIHGIARGILYLHQDSRLRIIHRDLKAGNILLDEDMMPKISDFGLARTLGANDNTTRTKNVAGTYGYISPEYAVHGRFSIKSDVFSFGVLMLEIVSGKKNRGFSHDNHSDNLLGHAWRLYKEDKCLELVSPSLRDSCIISEVTRSIHIGLLCVQSHAQDRPTMSSVVMMLGGEGVLPPPKQPAFFTEESLSEFGFVASSINEATITVLDAR